MSIPVPDVTQIQIHQTLNGSKKGINSFFVSLDAGTLDQTATDTFATVIKNLLTSSGCLADLAAGWSIDEVICTDLTSDSAPQFTTTAGNCVGTSSGQLLPTQDSLVLSWRTATRSGNGRGRSFFSGFTETGSDGNFTSGLVARWQDFADLWIADRITNDTPAQVVSRYNGMELVPGPRGQLLRRPIPRDLGTAFDITHCLVSNAVRTQRRRQLQA